MFCVFFLILKIINRRSFVKVPIDSADLFRILETLKYIKPERQHAKNTNPVLSENGFPPSATAPGYPIPLTELSTDPHANPRLPVDRQPHDDIIHSPPNGFEPRS